MSAYAPTLTETLYTNDEFANCRIVYVYDAEGSFMNDKCHLSVTGGLADASAASNVEIYYNSNITDNDITVHRPNYGKSERHLLKWRPVISYKFFPRDYAHSVSGGGDYFLASSLGSVGYNYTDASSITIHDYFETNSGVVFNSFMGDSDDGDSPIPLPLTRNIAYQKPYESRRSVVYNYDSAFADSVKKEGFYISELKVSFVRRGDGTSDDVGVPKFAIKYYDYQGFERVLFDTANMSDTVFDGDTYVYRHQEQHGADVAPEHILLRPYQLYRLARSGTTEDIYGGHWGNKAGTLDASAFESSNDNDFPHPYHPSLITKAMVRDADGIYYQDYDALFNRDGWGKWVKIKSIYTCSSENDNHIAYAKYPLGKSSNRYFGKKADHFNTVVSPTTYNNSDIGTIFIEISPIQNIESIASDNVEISIDHIKIEYYASTYARQCYNNIDAEQCHMASFMNLFPDLDNNAQYTRMDEEGDYGCYNAVRARDQFNDSWQYIIGTGTGNMFGEAALTENSSEEIPQRHWWAYNAGSGWHNIRVCGHLANDTTSINCYTYGTFMSFNFQTSSSSGTYKYVGLNAFSGEQTCTVLGPHSIIVLPNEPNDPILSVSDIKIDGISTTVKTMDPSPHSVSLTITNLSEDAPLKITNVCAVMSTVNPAEYNKALCLGYGGEQAAADIKYYWATVHDEYRNMQNTDFMLPTHSIIPGGDNYRAYKTLMILKNCFRGISSDSFAPDGTRSTYISLTGGNEHGIIAGSGGTATYELSLSINKSDKARFFDIIMTYEPHQEGVVSNKRYLSHVSMDFDMNRYGFIQQGTPKPDTAYEYLSVKDGSVNNYVNVGKEIFPKDDSKNINYEFMVIDKTTAAIKVVPYAYAKFIESKSSEYAGGNDSANISADSMCDCLDECISDKFAIVSITPDCSAYNDYGDASSGITIPPLEKGPLSKGVLRDDQELDDAASVVLRFTDTCYAPHGYEITVNEVLGLPDAWK